MTLLFCGVVLYSMSNSIAQWCMASIVVFWRVYPPTQYRNVQICIAVVLLSSGWLRPLPSVLTHGPWILFSDGSKALYLVVSDAAAAQGIPFPTSQNVPDMAHSLPVVTPRTPRTPHSQDPNRMPRFYPVVKDSTPRDPQVSTFGYTSSK